MFYTITLYDVEFIVTIIIRIDVILVLHRPVSRRIHVDKSIYFLRVYGGQNILCFSTATPVAYERNSPRDKIICENLLGTSSDIRRRNSKTQTVFVDNIF